MRKAEPTYAKGASLKEMCPSRKGNPRNGVPAIIRGLAFRETDTDATLAQSLIHCARGNRALVFLIRRCVFQNFFRDVDGEYGIAGHRHCNGVRRASIDLDQFPIETYS